MKIYCDLSGIYSEVKIEDKAKIVSLREIDGTNGYCAEEAGCQIRKRLKNYPPEGYHFLDNGNYHYLSRFWLEKIDRPFNLVVFDHHTDMQESSLIPALSCGNWILESIKDVSLINKVWLIGPPEADFSEIKEDYKKRIVFISETKADMLEECENLTKNRELSELTGSGLPVYISIDKDVISEEELKVNWDQGSMKLKTMLGIIGFIKENCDLIGVDICGEPDISDNGFYAEIEKSAYINKSLTEI